MTKANSALVCCDMIVRSLYLFQEKLNVSIITFNVRFIWNMVLLVILDALQNERNFRLFRIVKMANQRSGDPPSLFVLEARGERTPDTSFFSLRLKKDA